MKNHSYKMDKLPTVRRLPDYLSILRELSARGEMFVSSSYLAEKMGVIPILVRKDIELVRVTGTPRIGYSVELLIRRIENFLGWGASMDALLIGVGQLGTSILAARELTSLGLRIVAAFDTDPRKIGTSVHGVPVFDSARLEEQVKRVHAGVAILCVPSVYAQSITDTVVASGIRGIWNFTSARLAVPDDVITQKEDLTSGYAVLSAGLTRIQSSACRQKNVGGNRDTCNHAVTASASIPEGREGLSQPSLTTTAFAVP
jgi:redox-sensing transcriptional repressor